MRNEVVEYDPGRRLVWEPVRVADPGGEEDVPESGRYRWGFEFAPDGAGSTMVTESFDCTRSEADLREAVKRAKGGATRRPRRWSSWSSWPGPWARRKRHVGRGAAA